jgi:DNA-binding MarR family transcriptional regulator
MIEKNKTSIDPSNLPNTPLAFIFGRLTKKYYGAASKHFEELDMDRNFFTLKLIAKHEHITQQCLADYLHIDKASIVRIIDYLSEKKLVKREVSEKDRREHRIIATKKALKYVDKISSGFNTLNKVAFKGFTKQEKENFYTMMEKMHTNLSSLPAENYSLKYIKTKKTK